MPEEPVAVQETPEAAPAAEETAETVTPSESPLVEPGDGYTVDRWGTLPIFRCESCPFDHFERPKIEEHVQGHRPAVPRPLILGADGQPLTR